MVVILFQFLIGRLKTYVYTKRIKAERILFQFLIGRLKTLLFRCISTTLRQFQFLIGRLKTKATHRAKADKHNVSIPYR